MLRAPFSGWLPGREPPSAPHHLSGPVQALLPKRVPQGCCLPACCQAGPLILSRKGPTGTESLQVSLSSGPAGLGRAQANPPAFQQSQSQEPRPFLSRSWGALPTVSQESILFPFEPQAQRAPFSPSVRPIVSWAPARPTLVLMHVCMHVRVRSLSVPHSFPHKQPF